MFCWKHIHLRGIKVVEPTLPFVSERRKMAEKEATLDFLNKE